MADVTGFAYESFVEFLLRRLRYRDEWTAGDGRQYFYEKHPEATCHRTVGICAHAAECHAFSEQKKVPYGPWYDPDFFIVDGEQPAACIHVTHWSNPSSSQYKFWRTVEDHFEYKVNFGPEFLSINLVFLALDATKAPKRIVDSRELVALHGWKPATASVLAVSFDSSILFPLDYLPLEAYAAALPPRLPGNARKRREFCTSVWDELYRTERRVRYSVNHAAKLLKEALTAPPNPRYTSAAIAKLQDVCWTGRQRAVGLHSTETRYRKGIQHAFIVRELIARAFGSRIDPDSALWTILGGNPRFPWISFRTMLGADVSVSDVELEAFRNQLAGIPIQMERGVPIYLLKGAAGLEHSEWNPDLKLFILGLRHLKPSELTHFQTALGDLFNGYRGTYGMTSVLADLSDPDRIARKVKYVQRRFIGLRDKRTFVNVVAADMLTPGSTAPHQAAAKDVYNWPADLILEFYNLGSMQHITTALPAKFQAKYAHSLRPYAYMNNLGQLVSHLIAGAPIGQYFSNGTQFDEASFYKAIWPLFAECLYEAIGTREPLDAGAVEVSYRYKKAMRIISSPDLEPISFLLRNGLPALEDGPTLRGAFNQLSTERGWSRSALTTETTGKDSGTGAIIQSQSVIGRKNISYKTKELAGRMRSLFLRCDHSDQFVAESSPGLHFVVVDGDWPIESKINLLEAGFSGVFEIAQLATLTDTLETMTQKARGTE